MSAWVFVKCNCPNRHPLGDSPYGDYACGHRDGGIISASPNRLIEYGHDLVRIYKHQPEMFAVWRKICEWRSQSQRYGRLHLSPDEVLLWQLEIEQLQHFLSGEEYMGWDELELWKKLREEERLSYKRANHRPPETAEVLAEGIAICRASQETGNPVEFWS